MTPSVESRSTVYVVDGMDCPAEEQVIRARVERISGVVSLRADYVGGRLIVEHSGVDDETIISAIAKAGFGARREIAGARIKSTGGRASAGARPRFGPLIVSGATALTAEALSWGEGGDGSPVVIALAVTSVLVGGAGTLKKAVAALRSLTVNMYVLMAIGVLGAAAVGEWPEAAVVIFLFGVADLVETYATDHARNAVRALMDLTPETANVRQADGSWLDVVASSVATGAVVRVKPGDRVPLDGVVTKGASAVDESTITGESLPVEKQEGDVVFAGTINGDGVVELRTTGSKDETRLARIVQTVQDARSDRAPTQRFVDAFARVYTPAIVLCAALVAAVPPIAFAQPSAPWIYRALVLLVVGCPCALVISTPVTIVSALAAAARRGIFVKGGVYLEQGAKLRAVALDKTGTITEGRPRLIDVVAFGGRTRDDVLRIAASLDANSDHPIARAVAEAWTGPIASVENFRSVTGRGVVGRVDGDDYMLGSHRFAEERGVCGPNVEAVLGKLETEGKSALILASSKDVLGVLGVADKLRETSADALRELHELGVRTAMISGDNPTTAGAIARLVGIEDVRANLLPEEKLAAIDELLKAHGAVGMVGDGVNDAPALAKATVGFAMGAAGSDAALETADVALMRDDLRSVPEFIRLCLRTRTVLRQNIVLAITTKAAFFVLALFGVATMWMAVLADMGTSLIVTFNGLRLLRRAEVALSEGSRPTGAAGER